MYGHLCVHFVVLMRMIYREQLPFKWWNENEPSTGTDLAKRFHGWIMRHLLFKVIRCRSTHPPRRHLDRIGCRVNPRKQFLEERGKVRVAGRSLGDESGTVWECSTHQLGSEELPRSHIQMIQSWLKGWKEENVKDSTCKSLDGEPAWTERRNWGENASNVLFWRLGNP